MQTEISDTISVLNNGGTIIYPTDTIWGLGCDATNESAVEKIYSIKQRKKDLPLIVLLHDANQLYDYLSEVPDIAFDLIELSTRPLTIIFEKAKNLAKNVIGEDNSVAIRILRDDSCRELLRKFKKPLVSTSVNISGKPVAQSIEDIDPQIISKVDAIYRKEYPMVKNEASQIIRLSLNGKISIIRK